MRKKAEETLGTCAEKKEETRVEAELSMGWCEQAKTATLEKDLQECVKKSEETAKKAMDELKKTREAFYEVKDLKFELIKKALQHEKEQHAESLIAMIEKMKAGIDSQILDIEKAIKNLKEEEKKTQDKDKKARLAREIERLTDEKKRLELESKESAMYLETTAKMEENIDLLRIDLANANDSIELFDAFSSILEEKIPLHLNTYYKESVGGCLDEFKFVQAIVVCWPVEKFGDIVPLEDCELNFEV